jgi:restriction system protein
MYEEVVEIEKFDDEALAVLHNPDKNSQTEIGCRLDWTRTYLKKAGYL